VAEQGKGPGEALVLCFPLNLTRLEGLWEPRSQTPGQELTCQPGCQGLVHADATLRTIAWQEDQVAAGGNQWRLWVCGTSVPSPVCTDSDPWNNLAFPEG
jgi:hypothetical protein